MGSSAFLPRSLTWLWKQPSYVCISLRLEPDSTGLLEKENANKKVE